MAIYDPYKAMQEVRLRDPSLNLTAQATPYIGEGGGVGGKGGGRADDPGAFDDFGRNDPFGGGLYRTASQRDPGILTDLQRQAEQNRLGSIISGLMGRGGGDTPPLDTGYNINVNVIADLLKGLAGSPDRTPTGQAAVTESPTTQSQLSPEAQAQSQAQNIAIVAEMLQKAEEVKKRNPQFTDPYAGLEGKIASLGNVTTDQGGGQVGATQMPNEVTEYLNKIRTGEFVPPPGDKADAAELERLFSEIIKTPIRPVRPTIDETQLRQDFLPQPPPGKPWDQLTEEEQQDLYNKAIEQGKKKEAAIGQAGAQPGSWQPSGAGFPGAGGIMKGEFDPLKPPPPKGILANLAHLLKDPGFQKLAATGIIAATGGAGRGREAQAAVKTIEQGEALRLEREKLQEVKNERIRVRREKEAVRQATAFKDAARLVVVDKIDPIAVSTIYGLSGEQALRLATLGAAAKEQSERFRVDYSTGEPLSPDDPRYPDAVMRFEDQTKAMAWSASRVKYLNGETDPKSPAGKLMSDFDDLQTNLIAAMEQHKDGNLKDPEWQQALDTYALKAGTYVDRLNNRDKLSDKEKGIAAYCANAPDKAQCIQDQRKKMHIQKTTPKISVRQTFGPDGNPTGIEYDGPPNQLSMALGTFRSKEAYPKVFDSFTVLRLADQLGQVISHGTVYGPVSKLKNKWYQIKSIFRGNEGLSEAEVEKTLYDANEELAESKKEHFRAEGIPVPPKMRVDVVKSAKVFEDVLRNRFGEDPDIFRYSALVTNLAVKIAKMEEGNRLTNEDVDRQRNRILGVPQGAEGPDWEAATPGSVFIGLSEIVGDAVTSLKVFTPDLGTGETIDQIFDKWGEPHLKRYLKDPDTFKTYAIEGEERTGELLKQSAEEALRGITFNKDGKSTEKIILINTKNNAEIPLKPGYHYEDIQTFLTDLNDEGRPKLRLKEKE